MAVQDDLAGVPGEVKVEPSPSTGEQFPHLFGAVKSHQFIRNRPVHLTHKRRQVPQI